MDKKSNTGGIASSEIFNFTAPSNEYLTFSQSNMTIDSPSMILVRTVRIKPNYIDFNLLHREKDIIIGLEKSKDYLDYIKKDDLLKEFAILLDNFLTDYFLNTEFKPLRCELIIFNFPGEDYSEPMVRLTFPDIDDFDNLIIKDNIEEQFVNYLVNESNTIYQFREFKKIQKKFRFTIRRE